MLDEMPLLSPHSRTCSPGAQTRSGNPTGHMRERSTTNDQRGNLNEARPEDRHGHLCGQSEKATRKRADVELKPPVGESAAESARRPLLAHRVIAQFPLYRSLNRLGGCLGWKPQHPVARERVAGRQASMTEPFPAADGTWAVRPPSAPLAEQRDQKNKIVRKKMSLPFPPCWPRRTDPEARLGKREEASVPAAREPFDVRHGSEWIRASRARRRPALSRHFPMLILRRYGAEPSLNRAPLSAGTLVNIIADSFVTCFFFNARPFRQHSPRPYLQHQKKWLTVPGQDARPLPLTGTVCCGSDMR